MTGLPGFRSEGDRMPRPAAANRKRLSDNQMAGNSGAGISACPKRSTSRFVLLSALREIVKTLGEEVNVKIDEMNSPWRDAP